MTDPQVILRKLSSMREHISRLRRRRPDELEAFRADTDLQDATSMSLLVAVQDAVDIALHIGADEGWGVAASYGGSFEILAANDAIEHELADQLAGMAALRNRIAHGYASVDLARIWSELPAGIEGLEQYAAAIAKIIAPRAGDA